MIKENILRVKSEIPEGVTLVAVSKTKPNEDILEAYEGGQRVFGENKVQELVSKYELLPKDIEWHMIGHLQRNKVKYIVPFVALIHGVDSERLLVQINKEAAKVGEIVNCLLQIHIAEEETKFGFDVQEVFGLLQSVDFETRFANIKVKGFMAMATNTEDQSQIKKEFDQVFEAYQKASGLELANVSMDCLSMGMSGDYKLAIESGSNMIRLGSTLFGKRNYSL